MRHILNFMAFLAICSGQASAQDLKIGPAREPARSIPWEAAGGSVWRPRQSIVLYPNCGWLFHALSPDGQWLAIGERYSNRITLCDATSFEIKHVLEVPEPGKRPFGPVENVLFSPDGSWLLAIGNTVHRWKTSDLGRCDSFPLKRMLRWSSVLPNGQLLLAAGFPTRKMERWDVQTMNQVGNFTQPALPDFSSYALSANGRRLGILYDGLDVYDVPGEKKLLELKYTKSPSCIAFSTDGKRLALSSHYSERSLYLYDLEAAARVEHKIPSPGAYTALAFSPSGKTLAAGQGNYGGIDIIDVASGKTRVSLRGIVGSAELLSFSADGKKLFASANTDPALHCWDIEPGDQGDTAIPRKRRAEDLPLLKPKIVKQFPGIRGSLLVYSPDGNRLAIRMTTGGFDQTEAAIFDVAAGKPMKPWRAGADGIRALLFSRDGKELFVASDRISIVQVESGKKLQSINVRSPGQLGWTKEGNLLAICFSPKGSGVSTFAAPDWKKQTEIANSSFRLATGLAIHPADSTVALGNYHGQVQLWNSATRKMGATFWGPSQVGLLAFSPDGKRLFVAEGEHLTHAPIGVFDASSGQLLTVLHGHTGPAEQLAFINNGKNLVTVDGEDCLVWEAATGRAIGKLQGELPVRGIAVSPDGQFLALTSYSFDRTEGLWIVSTAGLGAAEQ